MLGSEQTHHFGDVTEIVKIKEKKAVGKNVIRKHENRYWLKNDDVYELHFTQFYDDEIILKFMELKEEPGNYIYMSELLKVEDEVIFTDSAEDAMTEFEDMIIEHIQEEIDFYENMLSTFNKK